MDTAARQQLIDSLKEIMPLMMAAGINLTPVSKAIEELSKLPAPLVDNAALERRAREIVAQAYVAEGGRPDIADAIRQDDQCLIKDSVAVRAVVSALTLAKETREACAKVAEEYDTSLAPHEKVDPRDEFVRGERHAARTLAAKFRSLPDALPLPGEGNGESILELADKAVTWALDNFGGYVCEDVDAGIHYMQARGKDRWSMQARMDHPECFGCEGTALTAEGEPCPVCQPDPASSASPVNVEGLVSIEALLSAVEADFTDAITDAEAPDDDPVHGLDGGSHITFGMIRRARQALSTIQGEG